MSKYFDDMRGAVKSYKSQRDEVKARVERIREQFGDEAATRESERQDKQLKAARKAAEDTIRASYGAGVLSAQEWGQLDGAQLTDDAKLIDADMIGADDFEKLKAKYKNNGTMLTALKRYGEKKNDAAEKEALENGDYMPAMVKPYNVDDIVTLKDKLDNWRHAKSKALGLLDMLDGTGAYSDTWTKALAAEMGDKEIENFGEGMNI